MYICNCITYWTRQHTVYTSAYVVHVAKQLLIRILLIRICGPCGRTTLLYFISFHNFINFTLIWFLFHRNFTFFHYHMFTASAKWQCCVAVQFCFGMRLKADTKITIFSSNNKRYLLIVTLYSPTKYSLRKSKLSSYFKFLFHYHALRGVNRINIYMFCPCQYPYLWINYHYV